MADEYRNRRLLNENDWVRIEAPTARATPGITVIALLLGHTVSLPGPDNVDKALPGPLAGLVAKNAFTVDPDQWDHSIAPLVDTVAALLGVPVSAPAPPAAPRPPRAKLGVDGGFRASYRATIEAFRRRHEHFEGRSEELETLTRLALNGGGYVVIEGEAWCGKSAVMTHLADHLRARDAEVVQFFVVEHSADTPAEFYPAVNVQLLDLLHEGGGVADSPPQQAHQFTALWDAAVKHATPTVGERLQYCQRPWQTQGGRRAATKESRNRSRHIPCAAAAALVAARTADIIGRFCRLTRGART